MTSIGGIFSFMSAITYILISVITNKQLNRSIIDVIAQEEAVDSPEARTNLVGQIKQVVSFEGIFRLNSQV